jgi:Elongation factor G C-terminus
VKRYVSTVTGKETVRHRRENNIALIDGGRRMSRVLNGVSDPGQPDGPQSEIAIHIIVPEEFAGASMGELELRRGHVNGMDVESRGVVIHASLPASEYDALQKAIGQGTQHRGKIEHAPAPH